MTHSNRRNRTRVGTAIGLTAALTALVGCAGGSGATGESGAEGALDLYTWISSESDTAQWESFVSLGQKEDPDLDISISGPSFNDYWTKVKTRLSGNNPPCLLTTQAPRAKELEALLMPLDDIIEAQDFDVSVLNEAMMDGMTVDGTIRGIPYDAEPYVMFYNADAFAEAGLEAPTTEYSRDQFIADAQALTTDDHKALALSNNWAYMNAWSIADEVTPVTDDTLTITSPEHVEQMQSYFDLVREYGLADAPGPADDQAVSQQRFISGASDMIIDGPWMHGTFTDAVDFTLGITNIPSTSGDPHAMIDGSGFAIASNCDNPDAAFEAIVAMTSTSVQEAQAAKRGIIPSRIEALPAWAEGKPEAAAELIDILLKNSTVSATSPNWNQVDTLFRQYAIDGFRGNMSAAEIAETIQSAAGE